MKKVPINSKSNRRFEMKSAIENELEDLQKQVAKHEESLFFQHELNKEISKLFRNAFNVLRDELETSTKRIESIENTLEKLINVTGSINKEFDFVYKKINKKPEPKPKHRLDFNSIINSLSKLIEKIK